MHQEAQIIIIEGITAAFTKKSPSSRREILLVFPCLLDALDGSLRASNGNQPRQIHLAEMDYNCVGKENSPSVDYPCVKMC
ncbi:hypothetical protein RRG08_047418 [Elysia crispata]|uniref:Uncharacterized protein n=1 Tax=Elysia crispata TaxID=231223 RepID=A0AAE0YVW8_9GAST|nr:hypothetical protein RRG08_047418 [Elysia crispata]